MFLPRSVQVKNAQCSHGASKKRKVSSNPCSSHEAEDANQARLSRGQEEGSKVNEEADSETESEEDESVISYSKLQRWPGAGEAVCVECGRYGAYIVDRTDQDVCSLECKARHLLKMNLPLTPTLSADNEAGKGVGLSGWSYREHPQVARMTVEQMNQLRSKVSGCVL